MNLDNARKGYAFEGDYSEVYDDGLAHLQERLRHQFAELESTDATKDAATIGFLRGRRCSQRDLAQIEVSNTTTARVLLAGREIILRADVWSDERVQDDLREVGYNIRGEGSGGFVRLVNNRSHLNAIRDTAAEPIVAQGLPNTLGVTASVGKGIGGPDPVRSPLPEASRNFHNYALPGVPQAHG